MPKESKVNFYVLAEIIIAVDELLREANERSLEILPPVPPKQEISDREELADYKHIKRNDDFVNHIRTAKLVKTNWIEYTQRQELQRERLIYERALDEDDRNITLWMKYLEFEMSNKQVKYARNLFDRAVTILPRANQFWYKYTYMEEMAGNIAQTRIIFDRWMKCKPDEQAWLSYIKFELRYNEIQKARQIYKKFVFVHPDVRNWIKYAIFEENHGFISRSRNVYETAIKYFGKDEKLYIAFAKFQEGHKIVIDKYSNHI